MVMSGVKTEDAYVPRILELVLCDVSPQLLHYLGPGQLCPLLGANDLCKVRRDLAGLVVDVRLPLALPLPLPLVLVLRLLLSTGQALLEILITKGKNKI